VENGLDLNFGSKNNEMKKRDEVRQGVLPSLVCRIMRSLRGKRMGKSKLNIHK
jgi:hypothetical protein